MKTFQGSSLRWNFTLLRSDPCHLAPSTKCNVPYDKIRPHAH